MGVLRFLFAAAATVLTLTGCAVGLTKEEVVEKLLAYEERELEAEAPAEFGPFCVNRHYKVFNNPPLVWDEARQACEDDGGRLAVIRDVRTATFFKEYLGRSDVKKYVGTGLWIGLNDIAMEGTLVTSDGHPFYADDCNIYQDWADGQPNDNTKRDPEGQDCVQLWKGRNFAWDDDYCNYRPKSYICEYDVCPPECVACP